MRTPVIPADHVQGCAQLLEQLAQVASALILLRLLKNKALGLRGLDMLVVYPALLSCRNPRSFPARGCQHPCGDDQSAGFPYAGRLSLACRGVF